MATTTKSVKKPSAKDAASSEPVVPSGKQMMYSTSPNSPFADKYDIAGEEIILADFLADRARQFDELDPEYDRWIELMDRKDRLETMNTSYEIRKGAESVVEKKEALSMNFLGSLESEQEDQMALHTKEAFRLFMGRGIDPEKKLQPIVGGKRIAAALRALWMLTVNDNPYAEWGLLRHEQTIKEVRKILNKQTEEAQSLLNQQKARGLTFSVLHSTKPQILNLGFKSPYGYAVAQLVSDFDYFVRVQKTLERKNLRSDSQVRQSITEITRVIRRVFNETARFDRWLMREEMKGLCRGDFVPGGTDEAAKRLQFAAGVFGPCPSEVFSGKLQPRHSQRRIQISPEDRKLLQKISEEMQRMEREAETDSMEETGLDAAVAKAG